jgi:hypothetical protein
MSLFNNVVSTEIKPKILFVLLHNRMHSLKIIKADADYFDLEMLLSSSPKNCSCRS